MKKFSTDELSKVLEDHRVWLETGGVEGNKADLREANLQGANLRGANLRGANLQEANLQGAKLRGAKLREANLRRVNLQEVNLQVVYLLEANLLEANLQEANLQGVNLQGANLRGVNLRGANLQEVNLLEANLRGANLLGAYLLGAYLQEVNLLRTCLSFENIPNADCRLFERETGGYVIGYRTRRAGHIDKYRDGRCYSADIFSTSDTECHPGLYLWPTLSLATSYSLSEEIIKVRTKAVDVHRACTKYRCRWFEVIGTVE